ncbi:MAG: 4-hydroxyphenylacetate 3-hydroxylase N-terminal domain-containing protein [Chloroflexota bacterium]
MAIRTPEQYLESLRDGRVVYIDGKRVDDVTKEPLLKSCVDLGLMLYLLYQDPRYHDLLVAKTEAGKEVPFIFTQRKNAQDLLRSRDYILTLCRICLGAGGGPCFVGPDALNALDVVSRRLDKEMGTSYSARVRDYRQYLLENDLGVAGAITDVKGDRSLRPAEQKPHKDFYVRIVEERKNGIVVRGAKFHISRAMICNEIFVAPTRGMREEDRDYAVSFAIPVNTPGVVLVGAGREAIEPGNVDEWPIHASRSTMEALIVFNDVFVPMERVFLKKEWRFAMQAAHMFGNFHRIYGDTYKYAYLEMLTGAAALMAEYNGIQNVEHVRDELAWLVMYTETIGLLGQAACEHCSIQPELGVAYPNALYSNAAKFFFANYYHEAVRCLQDITGGVVADLPSFKNFLSPETRPFIEKYFRGKAEVPTEHRLRAIMLAKDLCSSAVQGGTIHAEGSLAAQKIALTGVGDWERYKALARRAARISDGSEHPLTKEFPAFPPQGAKEK